MLHFSREKKTAVTIVKLLWKSSQLEKDWSNS
jgi:hypothetical protein